MPAPSSAGPYRVARNSPRQSGLAHCYPIAPNNAMPHYPPGNGRHQRAEIASLVGPAGKQPRFAPAGLRARPAVDSGRRSGRIVVESATFDDREQFQPLRQAAERSASPSANRCSPNWSPRAAAAAQAALMQIVVTGQRSFAAVQRGQRHCRRISGSNRRLPCVRIEGRRTSSLLGPRKVGSERSEPHQSFHVH